MTNSTRLAVLNTRPRGQAAELSRLLEVAGFEAVEAPAIEVVPAWDPADLRRVRRELARGTYEWVVLPSQNAGLLLADSLGGARLVCGSQTGRALGLRPEWRLDRFSASAALDFLRRRLLPGQHVLVPRGAEGGGELIDGLCALDAAVDAPIAYHTAAVDASSLLDAGRRLRQHQVHAVTVCSPSAAHSLLAALGCEVLANAALVCLGQTTADAARRAGLRVDAVAAQTTMRSLVAAVAARLGVAA